MSIYLRRPPRHRRVCRRARGRGHRTPPRPGRGLPQPRRHCGGKSEPGPPEGLTKNDYEDENEKEKELQMESLLCAFESLGKAWPRNVETQRCYRQELCKVMCERLKLSTWKVQLGVLQAMNAYFQGLMLFEEEHADPGALTEILLETCPSVTHSLENKSYTSIRTEALSVIELLLTRLKESKQWDSLPLESRELLIGSLTTMVLDSRPELQEKASLLKKTLENLY